MKIKVLVCDFYVNYDIFILNQIRWIILFFFFCGILIFSAVSPFTHFTSIEHVYKYRTVIRELVTIVTGF